MKAIENDAKELEFQLKTSNLTSAVRYATSKADLIRIRTALDYERLLGQASDLYASEVFEAIDRRYGQLKLRRRWEAKIEDARDFREAHKVEEALDAYAECHDYRHSDDTQHEISGLDVGHLRILAAQRRRELFHAHPFYAAVRDLTTRMINGTLTEGTHTITVVSASRVGAG